MTKIKIIVSILLIATIGNLILLSSCLVTKKVKTKFNPKILTATCQTLLNQSINLLEKAKIFNQNTVLKKLGLNKLNGFCFRFDENLPNAIAYLLASTETKEPIKSLKSDANNKQNFFELKNGRITEGDGGLIIDAEGKTELKNSDDLDLKTASRVILRLKVKDNDLICLGWSSDQTIPWNDWTHYMNVKIINDNKFHTYLIELEDRLSGWEFFKKGKLKKIGLLFPKPDNIELDYLHIIDQEEKYKDKPYGIACEKIGKEMRPLLYMRTPAKLGYRVSLPKKDTFLCFGMGILKRQIPIKFRIFVKDPHGIEEIFTQTVSNKSQWYQAELDMQKWKGKNVEIIFAANSESSNVAFWSSPILFSRPNKKFNVMMIIQDSLRADHLSLYGYYRKTSPFLDEFARKGTVFENAYSQGTMTVTSYASLMTSLYSSVTGVRFLTDGLSEKFLTLPEVMRSQGFETINLIQILDAGMIAGLHQGWDRICMDQDMESLLKTAHNSVENSKRNLFINIHLENPHMPFNPPEAFRNWYEETLALENDSKEELIKHYSIDPPWLTRTTAEIRRALYDGEIRYNDSQLQDFIDRLEDLGILNDTLIIFSADHGEFLGENSLWQHGPPGFIQVLHVPLIMIYPKKIPQKRIIQNVQLIDVMPTILDFARISTKEMLLQGESLVGLISGKNTDYWNRRPCYSDVTEEAYQFYFGETRPYASLFLNNFHILKSRNKDNSFELFTMFDLSSDKQEKNNLEKKILGDLNIKPKIIGFIDRFQEVNAKIGENVKEEAEYTLTQDEIESLKSLGYLQ